MKITIIDIPDEEEEELVVKCHKVSADTLKFLEKIIRHKEGVAGFKGDKIHRIFLNDIYYFEVVDGKSFFYLKSEVYESKMKLYEFEEICQSTTLFRASKSMIINSDKIDYIRPSLSGRFEVSFDNGEKVIVSRQYVNVLKEKIGL